MNRCQGCSLCNTVMSQIQLGGNSQECELLLISDFPRLDDDTTGYALTGSQYSFLWELLNQIGVKYQVTSMLGCIPLDVATRRYRKPTEEEMINCFNMRVKPIIDSVKPKAILLLGQSTVEAFIPGAKVADYRETTYEYEMSDGTKVNVLATYHPNYILSSENEIFYKRFIEDIVYACRHAMAYREATKYKSITLNADQFCRIARIWCDDPNIEYVGYDTESNGLDPWIPRFKDNIIFSSC